MKDTFHRSGDVGAITQQALGDKRVDFSVLQQFIAGEGEKTIVQDLLEKEKSRLYNTYKDVDIVDTMAKAPDMFRELDHREKINRIQLLALAKKIVQSETGVSDTVLAKMKYKWTQDEDIPSSTFTNKYTVSPDLTDEEKKVVLQEQQVRHIQNLLITGAGYRAFDAMQLHKKDIQTIDPHIGLLYRNLLGAGTAAMWNTDEVHEKNRRNTGSVRLETKDTTGVRIHVQADIFPTLVHEMMKGVVEYMSMSRYNGMRPEMKQAILSVDNYTAEQWQMLVGPQLWRQFQFLTKESIAQVKDEDGLVGEKSEADYYMIVYQRINNLPASEYLQFIKCITDGHDGYAGIQFVKNIIYTINDEYDTWEKQTEALKQQIQRQQAIQGILQESISLECDAFCRDYLKKIVENVVTYFPEKYSLKAIEKNIQRKIEGYFLQGGELGQQILQGKDLYNKIQEIIGEYKKEIISIKALKELQDEKWKRLQGIGGKARQQVVYSLTDVTKREQELSITHKAHFADLIQKYIMEGSLQEWIDIHSAHTAIKNELFAKLLTVDDAKPELMHDFGTYQLYNIWTGDQLVEEGSDSNLSHCVSGQASNIASGSIKIWSIRSNTHKNPANPHTHMFYTIGYNPLTKTIVQWKGYDNKTISLSDTNRQDMLQILTWLGNTYDIQSVNDVSAVLPEGKTLRSDGSITEKLSQDLVIQHYLAGKNILIGEKEPLQLSSYYTAEQVQKLCNIRNIIIDMTHVQPVIKTHLNKIYSSIIDNSFPVNTYATLMELYGNMKLHNMDYQEYVLIFPKLQILSKDIQIRGKEDVFYSPEETQTIESMKDYEWDEKIRKQAAYEFLKANNMDTSDNKAMIDAVKYTPTSIEIGGISRARQNLKVGDVGEKYTQDTSNKSADYTKAHIFKGEGQYRDEDYFTYAMVDKIKDKIPVPTYNDMWKTLYALPGGPRQSIPPTSQSSTSWETGSCRLYSILVGCQQSGYRRSGDWGGRDAGGYLWSMSPDDDDNAWAFEWDNSKGLLDNYDRDFAFPVRSLSQHSSKTPETKSKGVFGNLSIFGKKK